MADWNSSLYLKFKKELTQSAIDLANRVRTYHPERIADIGCGPGNSRCPASRLRTIPSGNQNSQDAGTDQLL